MAANVKISDLTELAAQADGDWLVIVDTATGLTKKIDVDNFLQVTSPHQLLNAKIAATDIGGLAIKLTNKTGAATVIGNLIKFDTAINDAVVLTGVNDDEACGVFLDAGVADGSEAWVVISGIADVLYDDNVAAVRGNWVGTGQAGLARTQAAPPALGIAAHFEEVGHCMESVSATGGGTFILARTLLQWN